MVAGLPLLGWVRPALAAVAPGVITTYSGGPGSGLASQLGQTPGSLALVGSKLYVSDSTPPLVRLIDISTGQETVVAGNGSAGFSGDGGPALEAQLDSPSGLAVDSKGDLFISDLTAGRIREVTPDGHIVTIAGGGWNVFSDGGQATAASLLPHGLAVDGHDNLYIADGQHDRIRKVDLTTGIIQTVAGNGYTSPGGDGGQATAAAVINPSAVAFDASGDLLIADAGNMAVRKVDATTGIISTIAGGGSTLCSGCPAVGSALLSISSIKVSGSGNLLISDSYYNLVHKVDKLDGTGTISTVAGSGSSFFGGFSGDGGPATEAQLRQPSDIASDAAGNLYITDQGNSRIRKVDTSQVISTYAGTGSASCGWSGDGGPALQAQLCGPRGLRLDAQGDLYFADTANRVRKIDAAGTITTVAGDGIQGYAGDGGPAAQAHLNSPLDVALDQSDHLFIADSYNHTVREVLSNGTIQTVAGTGTGGYNGDGIPATQAQLNLPTGVGFDLDGNLLIADESNHRIRRVDHVNGLISTIAGTGTPGNTGNGAPAIQAELNFPAGVAVDHSGNLFIADSGNNQVRIVNRSGIISVAAGAFGAYGLGDGGPAVNAMLTSPFAVGIGRGDVLYIDDVGDNRIRSVTPDGIIRTVVGTGNRGVGGFSGDGGQAIAAALMDPYGLALDSAGDLFIGDTTNHRIRRVQAYVAPGAPINVTASAAATGATLTWTSPPSDGGTPITSFTITPYLGSTPGTPTTVSGAPPPNSAAISGLTKGQTYTFVVAATNIFGTGAPSAPSNPLTVWLAPSPPTNVQAVAGHGSALITWTPPADDGGKPIQSYWVQARIGSMNSLRTNVSGSPPPATAILSGLNNGTFYTFTVTAINAIGAGRESAASNPVRPMDGGTYHSLAPARILDTRSGLGSVRAPLSSGQPRTVAITNQGGIPASGVSAVVLNVTVTDTTGAGFLTVYPTGLPRPTASNLNWTARKTVANLVEIEVGTGGALEVYAYGSSADVIFDVQGWVGTTSNSGGPDGLFEDLSPWRVLDTRDGTGAPAHKLGPGQALSLQLAGAPMSPTNTVPRTGVSAVVLNLTVTNPTQASYLTIYPTGGQRPVASNLNFGSGQTVANRAVVKLGTEGSVTIYNAAGSVDVIADLNGLFTDGTSTAFGGDFVPGPPTRIIDTRSDGNGPLSPGYVFSFQLLDGGGAPVTGVTAIVANVTATNTTEAGYLTLFPEEGASVPPTASDLNFLAGQTVPNLVVVSVGPFATFDVYNPAGHTDLIVDVVGYYGGPDAGVPAASAMRAFRPIPSTRIPSPAGRPGPSATLHY